MAAKTVGEIKKSSIVDTIQHRGGSVSVRDGMVIFDVHVFPFRADKPWTRLTPEDKVCGFCRLLFYFS